MLLPLRLGALVDVVEEVDTATRPLVVETKVRVLLPLTVTTVVTSCSVLLLTDVEMETMGLIDVVDFESVGAASVVEGSEVDDIKEREVVEEGWGFEDGTADGGGVELPGLLFEDWLAVSGADAEELEDVVGANGDDEELEIVLELADGIDVGVVEAPVLRMTLFCRC